MSRFHHLTVAEVRRETADSVSLRFDVPTQLKEAFAFLPGQYLTLRADIDNEDIRRSYSICSTPAQGTLRVGIRRVKGGAFSTFANTVLKAGDILDVMPPAGRFTPLEGVSRNLLGIAAGSGITPVLSIMASHLDSDAKGRFTLIYGNRATASAMFAEEIEDLKSRHLGRLCVIHIMSREAQDAVLLSGRIDGDKLQALGARLVDFASFDEALVCGPEGMIEATRAALPALGLPAERIRSELFTAAPKRTDHRAAAEVVEALRLARITAAIDGRRVAFDLLTSDENLIDAAARQGLDLPFSCKGGMCCTCRCKVVVGAADMAVNYSLEAWELEAGFILACQARPTTPELVLDFDAV
ncbi:MAG: 1,2-phenylacetyl-CoA epoxidase subunit PaaE [Beijerinckiaceae bacterium]